MAADLTSGHRTRRSSIEILRILAMLMIVFNHLQWRGGFIATLLSGWGGLVMSYSLRLVHGFYAMSKCQ